MTTLRWWAHPISDRDIDRLGHAEVTIRGEGKTIDFSGLMRMNCSNGRDFWRGPQNFLAAVTPEVADASILRQVQRNVYRLLCRDR